MPESHFPARVLLPLLLPEAQAQPGNPRDRRPCFVAHYENTAPATVTLPDIPMPEYECLIDDSEGVTSSTFAPSL